MKMPKSKKEVKVDPVVPSPEVKEVVDVPAKSEGRVLKVDLNKVLRAGDILPEEKYQEMKSRGIDVDAMVK